MHHSLNDIASNDGLSAHTRLDLDLPVHFWMAKCSTKWSRWNKRLALFYIDACRILGERSWWFSGIYDLLYYMFHTIFCYRLVHDKSWAPVITQVKDACQERVSHTFAWKNNKRKGIYRRIWNKFTMIEYAFCFFFLYSFVPALCSEETHTWSWS